MKNEIIILIVMFIINTVVPILMEFAKIKYKNEYDIRSAIALNAYLICINITVMGFLYFG